MRLKYNWHAWNMVVMFDVVCGFRDFSLALEQSRELQMSIAVFPSINQEDENSAKMYRVSYE